jgi:DNA primase
MSAPATQIPEVWQKAWKDFEQDVSQAAHAPGACSEFIRSLGPKDLVDLGSGVFKCLSPLRTEKTPSFWIYPDDRGWTDFGTAEGGDLIAFAKKYFGTANWSETLHRLAENLRVESWDSRKRKLSPGHSGGNGGATVDEVISDMLAQWNGDFVEEDKVFTASTWLAQRAHELLPSQIREHLHSRALTDEIIDGEKIGYVPEGFWQVVTDPATQPPFTKKELLATGWFHLHTSRPTEWASEDPAGRISEAFGGRIVMHYWRDGKARYSIGRKYHGRLDGSPAVKVWEAENPWAVAKYKKLPIRNDKRAYISRFIKNDVLWGEDCLRHARGQTLYITEGIVDAMMLKMLGFNAISPVTIAFAQHDVEHVLLVLRYAKPSQIIILNDTDSVFDIRTGKERRPGLEGAKKMAKTLLAHNYVARIASIPKPKDVAKIDVNDYVRNHRDVA